MTDRQARYASRRRCITLACVAVLVACGSATSASNSNVRDLCERAKRRDDRCGHPTPDSENALRVCIAGLPCMRSLQRPEFFDAYTECEVNGECGDCIARTAPRIAAPESAGVYAACMDKARTCAPMADRCETLRDPSQSAFRLEYWSTLRACLDKPCEDANRCFAETTTKSAQDLFRCLSPGQPEPQDDSYLGLPK